MIHSKFFRLGAAALVALVTLAASFTSSQAASGTVGVTITYNGCDSARGTVNFSNIVLDNNPPFSYTGDPIGVEVDILDLSSSYVFARWSGQATSGNTGSLPFNVGWQNNPPVSAGHQFVVQVYILDYLTGYYDGNATLGYYVCTYAPPTSSSGAGGVSYYPPDKRVLGTVKTTTSIYSYPDLTIGKVVGQLTAGQTWYIVGTAHKQTWYQVFVGGPNYAWVPASTMAPQGPVPVGNALYGKN